MWGAPAGHGGWNHRRYLCEKSNPQKNKEIDGFSPSYKSQHGALNTRSCYNDNFAVTAGCHNDKLWYRPTTKLAYIRCQDNYIAITSQANRSISLGPKRSAFAILSIKFQMKGMLVIWFLDNTRGKHRLPLLPGYSYDIHAILLHMKSISCRACSN